MLQVAIKQLFFDENMTELVVQERSTIAAMLSLRWSGKDLAREIDSFRHLSHKRLVPWQRIWSLDTPGALYWSVAAAAKPLPRHGVSGGDVTESSLKVHARGLFASSAARAQVR